MEHKFLGNSMEPTRCVKCGFHEIDHTDRATCETCGNTGNCDIIANGMLQCMDCIAKDAAVEPAEQGLMRGPKREIEKKYDQTIQVSQDIFNAKIATIDELWKSIQADDSIPEDKKAYTLAETLEARFKHLSVALFEIKEKTKEYANEQIAIQQYFNEHRKKLSAEEQAKIKLQDINYNPEPPKIKVPKAPKISKGKATNSEIRIAAAESGLPMEMIAITCISRNVDANEAVKILHAAGIPGTKN